MASRSMDAHMRRMLSAVFSLAFLSVSVAAQRPGTTQPRLVNETGLQVAPSLQLGAPPSSAAVADLNGDGNPDLVLTSQGAGTVTVLLGNGKGGFVASNSYAAGQQPGNVSLADINGDGIPDVVVTDRGTGSVVVLAGRGDGTFGPATSFAAIANPVAVAAANLSGKGKMDLVVAGSTGLAVLLNDGTGHLSAPSTLPLTTQPVSLTAADLRGQGHDDVIVGTQNGAIDILVGDGAGQLHAMAPSSIASGPISSVTAADFNHDGKIDLAVALSNSNQAAVLFGRGDGTFLAGSYYTVGSSPIAILSADLRGTGVHDLVTLNSGANTFSVLLGKGDGGFQSPVDFIAGNGPTGVVAGNFSGSGHADLVTLNGQSSSLALNAGNGDGTFVASRSYRAGGIERKAIATGDLNGDGRPDLVVANFCGVDATCSGPGNASVFLADAAGGYRYFASYALGSGPVSIALADLKGDHNLALVAINRNDKTLTVMPGNGDGTFGQAQTYTLAASPRALLAADLNGDGKADVAVSLDCGQTVCGQPGSLSTFMAQPDGSLKEGASYPTGFSPVSIASGDLRGTGHADLVVANACGEDSACKGQGTAVVFANDGSGRLTRRSEVNIGASPAAIALGKLSSAGLDLVVAQSAANKIAVLHGDGNGGFGSAALYPVGTSPSSLTLADIRGTGHLDVAVSNFQSSTVSLLYGAGNGSLQPAVSVPVGTGPEALVATQAGKTSGPQLITANGNSGSAPVGVDFTVVAQPMAVSPGAVTLSVTPAGPLTVDESVTLGVTVAASGANGTPTGNVLFQYSTDGGSTFTDLSDCGGTTGLTLSSGAVSCVTQQLPANGSLVIQANYQGDGTVYNGAASNQVTRAVNAAATKVGLTSSPASPTTDEVVTLTATVQPSTAPAVATDTLAIGGTVAFNDTTTSTTLCAAANVTFDATTGTASISCQVNAFSVATHSLNAVYSGDNNYGNKTGTLSLAVTAAPTATTVTPSPTSSTVDDSVTFNVKVVPNVAGTLSPVGDLATMAGTVTVKANGTAIGTCTTIPVVYDSTNGDATATCSSSTLQAGSQPLTAQFTTSNTSYSNSPASTSVPFTVSKADTSTSITSTGTWTVNQTVTLTATVTPHSPVLLANGGTVTFSDTGGTINNCSTAVTIDRTTGTASCTAVVATAGSHSIKAVYNGDGNYNPTTTANATPLTETVAKDNSSLALSASPSGTTSLNTSVTFTAAVTRPSGATEPLSVGTVAFSDNGTTISACASQTVTAGSAVCTYAGLAAGSHTVTATYSGDPNYNDSSNFVSKKVNASQSTVAIALTTGPDPSTVNVPVTYTITVTPIGNAVPLTGSVAVTDTFNSSTVPLAGCTAFNATTGIETCTTKALALGSHVLTATYSNDASYPPKSAPTATQTVNAGTATIALKSSASSAKTNDPVTFTATVTPDNSGPIALSGSVEFKDSVTSADITNCGAVALNAGVATCSTSSLGVGSHTITATYNNDTNFTFQAGGNTVAVTISQGTTTMSLVSSAASGATVNQSPSVSFTASIQVTSGNTGLTGTVKFTDNTVTIPNCGAVTPAPPSSGNIWTAVCTDPGLTTAGSPHAIAAVYQNDTSFGTANASLSSGQTVTAAATSVAVSSSKATSTVNDTVTFTAAMTMPVVTGGVPVTGTVSFVDSVTGSAIPGCSAAAVSAATLQAVCTTSGLVAGSHSISATYTDSSSPANFQTSTNKTTQTVNPQTTTLSVQTSLTPSPFQQLVTFTATLSFTPGSVPVKGTVAFVDSVTTVAIPGCAAQSVNTSSGVATCSTSALDQGSHTIKATFNGNSSDPNFSTSSGTVTQVIQASGTNAALASADITNPGSGAGKATVNDNVAFTLTLTSPGQTTANLPGTVDMSAVVPGGTAISICAGQLVTVSGASGTVTCSTSALPAGVYTVTASYTDKTNATLNAQVKITEAIGQAATTIVLSEADSAPQAAGRITVNDSVMFSAAVSTAIAKGLSFTGTLNFLANGVSIPNCGAVPVSAPSCVTTSLRAGKYPVSVTYNGDPNYTFNASSNPNASVTLTVLPTRISLVVVPSAATVLAFQPTSNDLTKTAVTFTASVLDASGKPYKSGVGPDSVPLSGAISFSDSLGSPMCVATTLSADPVTGGAIASCQCNQGTATAACNSLTPGVHQITASYTSDPNVSAVLDGTDTTQNPVNNSTPETVQDYGISASVAPPIFVTQGQTTANDFFPPPAINVVPGPVTGTGYTGTLSLTCMVKDSGGNVQYNAANPPCRLNNTDTSLSAVSVPVAASGTQTTAALVVDATDLSAGPYVVEVDAKDANGLQHNTTFTINVRAHSAPVTITSGGAPAGTTATFVVPGNVSLSVFANPTCSLLTGTGFASPTNPSAINISCALNGSASTDGKSPQTVSVPLMISTGAATASSQKGRPGFGGLPAVLCIPLLSLLGLRRARKSLRSALLLVLVAAGLCAAAMQVTGCGGGFTAKTSGKSGTTPPGSYFIKVTTDQSNTANTYEAVIEVNVQL